MKQDSTTTFPRPINRALVLAGGGAKGAYQFGCIEAFRDHGVTFDAVAGTSVGALNALILATGKFSKGSELWNRLSFESVYPIRIPKGIPRFAKWLLAFSYFILQMLWATYRRLPIPLALLWQVLLAAFLIALPLLAPFPYMLHQPNGAGVGGICAYIVTVILMSWLGVSLLRSRTENGEFTFNVMLVTPWLMFSYGIAYQLFDGWTQWVITPFAAITAFSCLFGFYKISTGVFTPERTLLGSKPLNARIAEILSGSIWGMPCFVTTAQADDVFDPDKGRWFTRDRDQDGCAKSWSEWEPSLERVWIPRYCRIDQETVERATQFCLASAALPFGIVPPVIIDKNDHVDGGVVDNVPVFPFIERMPAKEIFIVMLESFADEEAARRETVRLLDAWSEQQRKLDVARFPVPAGGKRLDPLPYTARNNPPTSLPNKERPSTPTVKSFFPSKSLGNFLSGTLNFDGKYAERIRKLGYDETSCRLTAIGFSKAGDPDRAQ